MEIEKSVDVDEAKKVLDLWLVEHGYSKTIAGYSGTREWNRFLYGGRPFWACFVRVFSMKFNGMLGVHVYDDGEVVVVSRKT